MRNPLLCPKTAILTSPSYLESLYSLLSGDQRNDRSAYLEARQHLGSAINTVSAKIPPKSRLTRDIRFARWDMETANAFAKSGDWGAAADSQLHAVWKLQNVVAALQRSKKAYGYDVCLTADSQLPLLDGTEIAIVDLLGKDHFWVYSINEKGMLRPGYGHDARLVEKDAPLLEVRLDNGKTIRCTFTERFMLRGRGYKRAAELIPGDSLMPLYRDLAPIAFEGNEYERTYEPGRESWKFTHRFAEARCPKGYVRHHKDLNRFNNSPDNLAVITWEEHQKLHQELGVPVTDKGRTARSRNMSKINSDRKGKPRPWAHFPHPWVNKEEKANILVKYRELLGEEGFVVAQKHRSQLATHKRWHTDRQIVSATCLLCASVNHKVVSVASAGTADVYDFIVDKYHNFALSAGVFVHNSGQTQGEIFNGSEAIANRENQKNIDDTAQPFEQHQNVKNPLNLTRDWEAENDYPSLAEKKSKRIHWPPRLR